MLVAQKAAGKDEPKADDMFEVGCVSTILQMLKLPDGTVKVLVEGVSSAPRVNRIDDGERTSSAERDAGRRPRSSTKSTEIEALRRAVTQQFDQYVKLNKKIPPEILTSIAGIDDPAAWPTPSPRTCRSSSTTSSRCSTWSTSTSAPGEPARASSSARSTSCRSRSASAAA